MEEFVLVLATPPNALIFSSGDVKMWDLIRAGFGMKIFGCLIILLASTTYLSPVFRLGQLTAVVNGTSIVGI
jgi:di/tricarboxylate transporter